MARYVGTSRPRTRRGLSSAFTLIELLVVLGIIVVLMALLLPNLQRARAQARMAVCGSNLHQLGTATNLYLDANDGAFWRYYSDVPAGSAQPAGRLWWFGLELNGPAAAGTTNRPLDKSQSVLGPYTANLANLLQCPDFPYDAPGYFPKFSAHAATYGYNIKLGPVAGETLRRTTYADRASSVFAFADGIQFDNLPAGSFNEGHYMLWGAGLNGYAHYRHVSAGASAAQAAFIDGHVEALLFVPPGFRRINGAPSGNLFSPNGTNSVYGF